MPISPMDKQYMEQVAAFFRSTIDPLTAPEGSIRETASHFNIARIKVQKILVTTGDYETAVTKEIQALHDQGLSNKEIAKHLQCSEATVSASLPYIDVFHGTAEPSAHTQAVRDYRSAEKEQKARQRGLREESGNAERKRGEAAAYQVKPQPEKPIKLMRLHLELYERNMDEKTLKVLRTYGGVKGETITRDLAVPANIPLYALHYAIQRAFGWQNSHLHAFRLPDQRLKAFCENSSMKWKQMVGILFRSPVMEEDALFWADDYEGGSFKNWLRKKYTGPYLSQCKAEGLYSCFKDVQGFYNVSFQDCKLDQLFGIFGRDPFTLLERLRLDDVLCPGLEQLSPRCFDGFNLAALTQMLQNAESSRYCAEKTCQTVTEELSLIGRDIEAAFARKEDSPSNQVRPRPVTTELIYRYDFGDNWTVSITGSLGFSELVADGILSENTLDRALSKCRKTYRPVLLVRDGEMVMDDVGGLSGFADFLLDIHPDLKHMDRYKRAQAIETRQELLDWARRQGWRKNDASNYYLM